MRRTSVRASAEEFARRQARTRLRHDVVAYARSRFAVAHYSLSFAHDTYVLPPRAGLRVYRACPFTTAKSVTPQVLTKPLPRRHDAELARRMNRVEGVAAQREKVSGGRQREGDRR